MTKPNTYLRLTPNCALLAGVLLLVPALLHSQSQSPARLAHRHQTAPKPATAAGTEPAGIKAIFEPVNYGQDVNLTDVFFTSADEGWVSGENATILKTTDGGAHWTAQVGGDPNGNEKPIGQLRFLDARHGWAISQDSPQRLLRTLDGENWEQIGQQPAAGSGFVDYAFTSVRHGIALGGNMGGFYATNDGGRHWQNVGPCRISVTIQGLPQTQDCYPIKLQMLSANSGLAFTHWRSPEAPNATSLAIFRTDNGGQSWNYVVPAFHDNGGLDIFFTDMEHGVVVFDNKTYVTADGGRNWRALLSGGANTVDSRVRFADPQVGWSLGAKYPALALSYTTDGGRHWKTFAPLRMPGDPNANLLSLSLPRRDRAYIAGPHGMVYRYRIVPANYAAENSFDAPPMPAFGAVELSAKAGAIRHDIDALRTKLAALPGGAPGSGSESASGSTGMSASASPTESPTTDTGQGAGSNAAAASGGFTQQTDVSATADVIASGNSTAPTFTQDASPPSDALADCCAAAVQQLQTDTAGFVTQLPQVTSQYRPLNLIVAGVQLAATLLNQGQGLWSQFKILKHAPNAQAVSAALQQLSTMLNTAQQVSSSGLQNPGGWFAANAPASVVQDVGSGSAGTGSAPASAAAGTFSAAAPASPGFTSGAVGTAAANASSPQPGVAFAAVVQRGASTPLTMATAQVVSANAKSQDLNTLAADNAVLQSLQQGATGAVQQAASGMSSAVANSLSAAASGLVGGVFKKRPPTVVYLWGLPNNGGAVGVVSNQPSFQINYASIPGVNPADYAPALIRLVPAQNGWFLVGAAKGQAGALQSSSADWDVYSSFSEHRVPAQVSQISPGQARIQPAQALAPGAYAVVLRPVVKNKKFSGTDLAGLQGDGLVFNSVWRFVVGSGSSPQ